jgi:hypothetical protein
VNSEVMAPYGLTLPPNFRLRMPPGGAEGYAAYDLPQRRRLGHDDCWRTKSCGNPDRVKSKSANLLLYSSGVQSCATVLAWPAGRGQSETSTSAEVDLPVFTSSEAICGHSTVRCRVCQA